MLAVYTDVLIRFPAADDAKQAQRALELLRDTPVWVAKTVLLEKRAASVPQP